MSHGLIGDVEVVHLGANTGCLGGHAKPRNFNAHADNTIELTEKATQNNKVVGGRSIMAVKESEKGYPRWTGGLGAKEWMNVSPARRQLQLVRR